MSMLDELLISLSEVSKVLLPFLGAVALIMLIVVLFRLAKIMKELPNTLNDVNHLVSKITDTVETTHTAVDKLNEPLDALIGVSKTVDAVNRSATGIVSSVASYAVKHSDSLGVWAKGLFSKKNVDASEKEEEDFGIYE